MTSPKRRTTSKSGNSARSTPKTATSRRNSTSSPTAARSFEEVFGTPESPELIKLKQQLTDAQTRLAAIASQPVPTIALHRTRHLARQARLRKYCTDLAEAIHHEEKTDKVSK